MRVSGRRIQKGGHSVKNRPTTALAIAAFLLPAVAVYAVFLISPIAQTVYQSFFKWNGIAGSPMVFNGLSNYGAMLRSKDFWNALKNSGIFMLVGFGIQMPIAFLLALFITSKLKGVRFFKTAFFIPVVLPMTAIGIMWNFILWPMGGLLNNILQVFGMSADAMPNWLGIHLAPITIPLVSAWAFVGYNMLIFAAGIVSIPTDIYEAAMIDGATGLKQVLYITIPLLRDSFKIYAVLCVTGCLKVFEIVFVMTGGGPNGASDVPATLLYYAAFRHQKPSLAMAISVAVLILALVSSLLLNKLLQTGKRSKGVRA